MRTDLKSIIFLKQKHYCFFLVLLYFLSNNKNHNFFKKKMRQRVNIKVGVFGDGGVGKTALTIQFCSS